MSDPFGTADLRERVLGAWREDPVRFREDANLEDDARVGHTGRVVVELAQNARDAAARAGVPGRLLLRVEGDTLYAANVGAPLDADGVAALSHLRVSPKAAGEVGRYGVGFKAVLSVTDEPAVVGRAGGVRWSAAETRALAAAVPALAAELDRRGGAVPVMRLPFPAEPDPVAARLLAEGWDTVVRLPLRGGVRPDLDVAESLLLFLPGLAEVVVEDRVVRVDPARWHVLTRTGTLPAELLADRPVEERERPAWTVAWAAPVGHALDDDRLHAPQPTAERVALPALLAASFPLDPSRRHVEPGPLAAWVAARAAEAYADLLAELADPLPFLPASLPAGPVDLAVREHLAALLPRTPLLPSAADPEVRLRGEEAVLLDLGDAAEPATRLLARHLRGLVEPRWRRVAGQLGVSVLGTADLVDLLRGLDAEPAWWRDLYAALGRTPDRDALRALPVPLADGSVAVGPPGLVLPGAVDAAAFEEAGIRLRRVHPDAAHDLLLALGAVRPDPAGLLDDPRVRAAVEESADEEDPEPLAHAVLSLLAADPGLAAGRPWLADLALRNADGEPQPAGELLLPGGRLAGLVDAEAGFGFVADDLVDRYGADALVAAGVLRTFALVRDTDVTEPDHLLDGEEEWLRGPVTELVAVRDLELVRDDRWADALDELAGPELADAMGPGAYTTWWLSTRPCVPTAAGLATPDEVALPEAPEWLRVLFDPAVGLTPRAAGLVARLGGIRGLDEMHPDQVGELLRRLGDRGAALGEPLVRRVYSLAVRMLAGIDQRPDPWPERVVALTPGGLAAVPRGDALVVDRPDLAPLLGDRPVVPCSLGDALLLHVALDVPRASDLGRFGVRSAPAVWEEWEDLDALRDLLRLLDPPESMRTLLGDRYAVHDGLLVNDAANRPARTSWRVHDGVVHVDRAGGVLALSRAVAYALGLWSRRDAVAVYLAADDAERAYLLREALLDPPADLFQEEDYE